MVCTLVGVRARLDGWRGLASSSASSPLLFGPSSLEHLPVDLAARLQTVAMRFVRYGIFAWLRDHEVSREADFQSLFSTQYGTGHWHGVGVGGTVSISTTVCPTRSVRDLVDTALWWEAWDILRQGSPQFDSIQFEPDLSTGSCGLLDLQLPVLYAPPDLRDEVFGSCPACGLIRHWWSPWADRGAYRACTGPSPYRPGLFLYTLCCSFRCREHYEL